MIALVMDSQQPFDTMRQALNLEVGQLGTFTEYGRYKFVQV
jgi:hypothetical protein